jgi:tetratricopeptide (TPR) repeat protein
MLHPTAVTGVEFSPDGRLVLTSCDDTVTRLWDATTGAQVVTPMREAGGIGFSPDGRRILAGTGRGGLQLWDVATGLAVTPPLWPELLSGNACFSPDGRRLAAALKTGEAVLWNPEPDERPLEDLTRLAVILSGTRVDGSGAAVPISNSEIQEAYQALVRKNQGTFRATPDQVRGWHHQKVGKCESAGAWADAITHLDYVIEHVPNADSLHFRRGSAHAKLGHWPEAIASYREAIRLNKDDVQAHNGIGIVFCIKGQWDEATASFREAIRLRKNDAVPHTNLGNALKGKGQLDEAIASYREAIRLSKDNGGHNSNLGAALLAKGRLDEAIASCREAIRLANDDVEAHINLGAALLAKGHLDESIDSFREAIRLKNDYAEAHKGLGAALQAKGHLDDAIASFREAVRLNNNNSRGFSSGSTGTNIGENPVGSQINLGNALHANGQRNEAVACYQEAIRSYQQPTRLNQNFDATAHRVMAWFLATCPEPKFRDVPQAVELAKKAVMLAPSECRMWSTLGVCLYRAGDCKAAIEALEKSGELRNGGDSFDWFFLAMAHWQLGKKEKARRLYDQAVEWMDKNQPKNAELIRFRAEAAELLGVKNDEG